MAYILGIDTGGTCTDGVLMEAGSRFVVKKAKTYTTKEDLKIGIGRCIDKLDIRNKKDIRMVVISTTLATNAVIENKICDTGLVLIGYESEQAEKFPACTVENIRGKMDIRGNENVALDEKAVMEAAARMAGNVEAIAISGYASVRNPKHEERAKEIVRQATSIPVFCAHEQSGNLGFVDRTITTVFNAGLVKIVSDFIIAIKRVLKEKGIEGTLMMVKSDGSLMSAEMALEKPVLTILSGPAASVIGAIALTGARDAIIADMGGTTLDIAYLKAGKVKMDRRGALIGGWRTQVKAMEISTHGIGCDSEITVHGENIEVGPQRIIPVSRTKQPGNKGLTPTDIHLYLTKADKNRSDSILVYIKDNFDIEEKASTFINKVEKDIRNRIIMSYVQSIVDFENDGILLADECASKYLISKFCSDAENDFLSVEFRFNKPIIAVGAPAKAWLAETGKTLHTQVIIPENADVANAIGAASAKILESARAEIRREHGKRKYNLYLEDMRKIFYSKKSAAEYAFDALSDKVRTKALKAGCCAPEVRIDTEDTYYSSLGGKRKIYVGSVITAFASGVPDCVVGDIK